MGKMFIIPTVGQRMRKILVSSGKRNILHDGMAWMLRKQDTSFKWKGLEGEKGNANLRVAR